MSFWWKIRKSELSGNSLDSRVTWVHEQSSLCSLDLLVHSDQKGGAPDHHWPWAGRASSGQLSWPDRSISWEIWWQLAGGGFAGRSTSKVVRSHVSRGKIATLNTFSFCWQVMSTSSNFCSMADGLPMRCSLYYNLSYGCVDGHWCSKEAKYGVSKVGKVLITQLEVGIVYLPCGSFDGNTDTTRDISTHSRPE